MNIEKYIDIKPEVREAIDSGRGVVALESTIISHGMPYPDNVKTALELEEIVKSKGAVPATIAILNGRLKVGLSRDEIEFLGKEKGIVKVSRRDMPFVIAKRLNGATTVASTMIIAALAGIRVFATGGIGGVHRGAQESFDISADLIELSKTNVAVVCAGAKSILDIGLTLEVLETLGVPTVGYKTDDFPAFYTRRSGFNVDYRCDTPDEIANALKSKWDLGLNGGIIVANPVPAENEMDEDIINAAIENALNECNSKGISGKKVTPFLLSRVKDITGGRSLETNIALVKNNAALAGEIVSKLMEI